MKIAPRWTLLALPLALAACGGDEEVETEMPAEDMAMEAPMAGMDTAGMAGMEGGMPATLAMMALNESGVTGQATVTPSGNQLQVMVQLSGLTEGAHPGHIHQGTCESPGSVVAPLQEISAGADGTGNMTTTVDVDPMTAMDGQHIVAYHPAGGGPPVVCGQIPQHQM